MITKFCLTKSQKYLKTISVLDLSKNLVEQICEDTMIFLQNGKLTNINLAHNKLTTLSNTISKITSLQSIKLSRNHFKCSCEMTWMIQWLPQQTPKGERIVKDYKDVVCHSGMLTGKQIVQITPEKMGCYPQKLNTGEKVTIGVLGTLIVGIVIAIIAISRRWNEVKWLLYLHFNILDKSDRNEDLNGKNYDAFISYR